MAKVIGYHACERGFAERLQSGEVATGNWLPSQNDYDWLGHGIYFWEGNPRRAEEWAEQHILGPPGIIEAEIGLGDCFDPTTSEFLGLVRHIHAKLATHYAQQGWILPTNEGGGGKLRKLDCLVINRFLQMMELGGGAMPIRFQTVRCPFEEGEPIFPGSMIRDRTHIQVAVRDNRCIQIRDIEFP